MKLVGLLLALLLAGVFPGHAASRAEVEKRLAYVDVLRARYSQTRYIQGLAEPLTSSGTLLLARLQGLVWTQQEPFRMQYVITRDVLVQNLPGQPRRIRKKAENAELFRFISLFASPLEGRPAQLDELFDISFTQESSAAWTMILVPRPERMRKLFASVTLKGDDFIEEVVISEASGNRTVIKFRDVTTTPSVLSQDEKLYFED